MTETWKSQLVDQDNVYIGEFGDREVFDKDDNLIAIVSIRNIVFPQNVDQNIRLIVAAPEMLAMLQYVKKLSDGKIIVSEQGFIDFGKELEALIKKAKGESNETLSPCQFCGCAVACAKIKKRLSDFGTN
jgi:hypothetical protein